MVETSPPSPRKDAPSGLFFSRDGAWFHDGEPIRHARLAALLSRSVARDEEGRLIVTTGRDRLPFVAEDAPLLVKTARVGARGLVLVLSDGTEEPALAGARILVDEEGRVRSPVKGGRFWALWARPAVQALFARVLDDGGLRLPGDEGDLLVLESKAPRDWSSEPGPGELPDAP